MTNTIIIIDDDQEDLDLMKQALTEVDPALMCISFVYPEEALRVLLSRQMVVQPSFIFIDINMPGLTGDKCLKRLREEKLFDSVIITLYSTSMPDTVAEALKSAGANYVFEKPVRMKTYKDILEKILHGQPIVL